MKTSYMSLFYLLLQKKFTHKHLYDFFCTDH